MTAEEYAACTPWELQQREEASRLGLGLREYEVLQRQLKETLAREHV